ncbi:hypothetical protein DM860_014768 [Cuscuta australis]|uniref:DUF4283 domain-containing protein n=1 Tax=Cuscuta australis TaxID=267555 RepID=A0A328CZN3_9ASTE|nr:hypothetical protein DM860_014768 [Cuscuta australis]
MARISPESSAGEPTVKVSRLISDVVVSGVTHPLQGKSLGHFKGTPTVSFPKEDILLLSNRFKLAMIGSFQRRPPFPVMEAFLNRLGLCGKFSFSILSHRKLLINFMAEEDYIRVLCRKTWDVHGRIMRVTKWSPALSPEIYNPVVLVWISIPDLPIHLHDMRALRLILSHLGNPIMVDLSTKNFSRPALARVCVEMDVSNLPVPKVLIIHDQEELIFPILFENPPE